MSIIPFLIDAIINLFSGYLMSHGEAIRETRKVSVMAAFDCVYGTSFTMFLSYFGGI